MSGSGCRTGIGGLCGWYCSRSRRPSLELEPRESGWQLEQHRPQLPVGESQQRRARQAQRQSRFLPPEHMMAPEGAVYGPCPRALAMSRSSSCAGVDRTNSLTPRRLVGSGELKTVVGHEAAHTRPREHSPASPAGGHAAPIAPQARPAWTGRAAQERAAGVPWGADLGKGGCRWCYQASGDAGACGASGVLRCWAKRSSMARNHGTPFRCTRSWITCSSPMRPITRSSPIRSSKA